MAAAHLRLHEVSPVLSVNPAQRRKVFCGYIYLEWFG
jgi:hypothetical protein